MYSCGPLATGYQHRADKPYRVSVAKSFVFIMQVRYPVSRTCMYFGCMPVV
jgi:hypothetical protein